VPIPFRTCHALSATRLVKSRPLSGSPPVSPPPPHPLSNDSISEYSLPITKTAGSSAALAFPRSEQWWEPPPRGPSSSGPNLATTYWAGAQLSASPQRDASQRECEAERTLSRERAEQALSRSSTEQALSRASVALHACAMDPSASGTAAVEASLGLSARMVDISREPGAVGDSWRSLFHERLITHYVIEVRAE
jgi:hypothetical protein